MKLIFMGSAGFAVPALRSLKEAGHDISLVVCQPDRPKGRGHRLQAPPLKTAALLLGLKVFQPEKIREPAALERLRAENCDVLCVAAYGQILPQALLDAPRLMPLNVHASLLPKYRGAAPIEWALARGEAETGVSIQRMVFKLDAGDVLLEGRLKIEDADDAEILLRKLSEMGAKLLVEALRQLEAGTAVPRPQDEAAATYAPLLKKKDGAADFSLSSRELFNRWRAFKSRPGFYAALNGEVLKVLKLAQGPEVNAAPGTLVSTGPLGFQTACGQGGSVWIEELVSAGGRPAPAAEWAKGHRLPTAARFETPAFEGV